MDKLYNQVLNKIILGISKPDFKKKINQHIVDPILQDVYQKSHNYFITIISLYSITILLLLLILSILISRRYS